MGAYNESLIKAGVFAGAEGLAPATEGFVVDFAGEKPIVTDGPYGETHELFNGFWIIEVSSKEEAVEWASRAPLGPGSKLEVRRMPSADEAFADFADNEYIKKEAELPRRGSLRRRVPGDIVTDIQRTVDAVWRIESARIVATLAKMTGDVGLAEDLARRRSSTR